MTDKTFQFLNVPRQPPRKCVISPVRPERSEAQSKDTYPHALGIASMLTRDHVHRVTP